MAINTSYYLDDMIFDMTGQNKKVAWWKRPFLACTRNKGIYAYETAGQCSFPLYCTSGPLLTRLVIYLVKDHPLVLNGGQFGMEEIVHRDAGGAWRPVLIDTYTTRPFEVLNKLYSAFHELKEA